MDRVMDHSQLWSIVLAEREGEQLRPLIQHWLGRHKPKQYCTFVGTRSMLQHTLDRADRLTPPERKVTVIAQAHQQEAWLQLGDRPSGTVILQPANRGTAAGIFLPLTYVRARDPNATVMIYPSDHFVYPEARFAKVVQHAILVAQRLTDRLVLLGASPDRLELEYGWIQPGEELGWTSDHAVRAVEALLDKPGLAEADAAMSSGALWNTLVMTAKIEVVWKLGWRCVPMMMPLFERLGEAIGTSQEAAVRELVYRVMPVRDFSSDLLQRALDQISVIELTGVLWSDWGTPERILDTLCRIGKQPAFPREHLTANRDAHGRDCIVKARGEQGKEPQAAVPVTS